MCCGNCETKSSLLSKGTVVNSEPFLTETDVLNSQAIKDYIQQLIVQQQGDVSIVPAGGAINDVLTKRSAADLDTFWQPPFSPSTVWKLYNPAGTAIVAQTTSGEALLVNKMVEGAYLAGRNFQMALDTSVGIPNPAETGRNRGKIIIGTNQEAYFEGYAQYNNIVTFQNSGHFNNMGGSGVLSGLTGPQGFINLSVVNGWFYIENRVQNGVWLGWVFFPTSS